MSAPFKTTVTSLSGALTTILPFESEPLKTYVPPSVIVTVPSFSSAPLPLIFILVSDSVIFVAFVRSGSATLWLSTA